MSIFKLSTRQATEEDIPAISKLVMKKQKELKIGVDPDPVILFITPLSLIKNLVDRGLIFISYDILDDKIYGYIIIFREKDVGKLRD